VSLLSEAWCLPHIHATTPAEAIAELGGLLEAAGRVKSSFVAAAIAREERSPTGLPFAPPAVALPHAETEHVVLPTIAIATLAHDVDFQEMGSPESIVKARIVVMPALTAKEQAAASLARIIEVLQDDELRAALVSANTAKAIHDLLAPHWSKRATEHG
jgi:PTS system galactitol-specific IIA component